MGQFVSETRVRESQGKQTESLAKQGGNVVTYFCTPEQEVLGWIVGPVAADQLAYAGEEALKARDALRRLDSDDERPEKMRDHFQSRLSVPVLNTMRVWSSLSPEDIPNIDEATVSRVIGQANATRNRLLGSVSSYNTALIKAGRFTNPAVRQASIKMTRAIRADETNMVLAELPLVSLKQVRRPVFERLARQRFEPRSARNDELFKKLTTSIAQRQPTLLIVTDGFTQTPKDLPTHRELPRLEKVFLIQKVTRKELTRLSDDLNHDPPQRTKGAVRYVLINGQGERTGIIALVQSGSRNSYRSILGAEPEKSHRTAGALLIGEMKHALVRQPAD